MKNIKIDPNNSYVELIAKDGVSVADALKEAIEFCKSEGFKDCTLSYNGFLFDIEPKGTIKQKVKEYNRYIEYRSKLPEILASTPMPNIDISDFAETFNDNWPVSSKFIKTGSIKSTKK